MKTSNELEILEARIAPAGIVTVVFTEATGTLAITGDGADNSVSIFQTAKDNYRIEAFNATGIGVAGISFKDIAGKVKVLNINLGGGNDDLDVTNFSTLDTFTLAAAGDDVSIDNLGTKKNAEFALGDGTNVELEGLKTTIGGDLVVAFGTGGGFFELSGVEAKITGAAKLTGGTGSDIVEFSPDKLTIGKGIAFNTGAGGDTLRVNAGNAVIGKGATAAIDLITGADGGFLALNGGPTQLKGALNLTGGAGSDSIQSFASELKIDGDFKFAGGLGGSDILLNNNIMSLKGVVNIDLGADSGSVDLRGNSTLDIAKTTTIKGGLAGDSVSINGGTVNLKGAIDLSLGAGNNDVGINGNKLTVGNGLKLTGGIGSENLSVGGTTVTVKGPVTLIGDAGSDSFSFDGTTLTVAGPVDVTGGLGNDTLGLFATSLTVSNSLLFNGGGDDDSLQASASKAVLKKGFEFTGADGFNQVDIFAAILEAGGDVKFTTTGTAGSFFNLGTDSLKLAKALSITGGAGDDQVSVFGDGSIKGDVTIDLLGADGNSFGSQDISLGGSSGLVGILKLGGKLTAKSAAIDPLVVTDSFSAFDVSVAKAVEITLGATNSFVAIENISAGDTFKLDTGAESDFVEIDRGNLFGPSSFKKLATILLGLGDDTILIGGPSILIPPPVKLDTNNTGIFKAGLTVDGGLGTNERNDFGAATVNTITGTPTISGTFALPLLP